MTRTLRRKVGYVIALVAGMAVVGGILAATGWSWPAVLIVALVLLLPGRIQGHYWRPFFRGRRLMAAEDYESAIREFTYFLSLLDRRPWLERLIWLNWSIYTDNARAMALNNIGAAHIMLGRFTEAERVLDEALEWDREAPLAHFNQALAARAQGKDHAAQQHLHRARELGYAAATSDRLVHSLGLTLAKLEGQGVSRT